MIHRGRGRSQGRGCCIVVPIGCLFSVMLIVVFSGLALARLL
jgi:hypothetical protein